METSRVPAETDLGAPVGWGQETPSWEWTGTLGLGSLALNWVVFPQSRAAVFLAYPQRKGSRHTC